MEDFIKDYEEFKKGLAEWQEKMIGIISKHWCVIEYANLFNDVYGEFIQCITNSKDIDRDKRIELIKTALTDLYEYSQTLNNLKGFSRDLFNSLEDFAEFIWLGFDGFVYLICDYAKFTDDDCEKVYNYIWQEQLENLKIFLDEVSYGE